MNVFCWANVKARNREKRHERIHGEAILSQSISLQIEPILFLLLCVINVLFNSNL
jgi:hypothetical protein